MTDKAQLRQKAINAAKKQNWEEAIQVNQQLLDLQPNDTNALNRMGTAQLQLKKVKEAKTTFTTVLKIDKTNIIAKKQLERIKNKQATNIGSFTNNHFIEEPGKTKVVELHRLAGKQALETLAVGVDCQLKMKKRYISVETGGQYVGALPEDISFRLAKLIDSGNTYSCKVRSCSQNSCSVYLKEESCSDKNKNVHSFPPGKLSINPISDVDEKFLLEDDVPFEVVDHDSDTEKTLDDVDQDKIED